MASSRSMFGRTGLELLKEVAYCDIEHMPPHNDAAIREILDQISAHYSEWERLTHIQIESGDKAAQTSASIHHESILRNKRLLLLYHQTRLAKIEGCRWQHGLRLPSSLDGVLSPAESAYFNAYDAAISTYQNALGLDLTTEQAAPGAGVRSLVSIRIRKGEGTRVTMAHGDVFLRPNVVHWIPRPDAVHLIRDGIAEEVGDADIFTRT